MKATIETQIKINATPEEVWSVLMKTEDYPTWNPFVKRLTGDISKGGKIKIQLPGMKFKPSVIDLEKNKKFSWLGKLGIKGIFDGHHQFELVEQDDATLFVHKEEFSGLLVKWFIRTKVEETKEGFQAMNIALKNRVES